MNKKTKEEIKFEKILKELKIPYQYNHQLAYLDENNKIGYFYVDFLINNKLVIFINGLEHKRDRQKIRDELQELILGKRGFCVLRITNWDINNRDRGLFIKRLTNILINIEFSVENKRMY